MVTAGNDKGKTGEVLRVIPKGGPRGGAGREHPQEAPQADAAEPAGRHAPASEMPIHISNVSPVVDGKPTRVRFETRRRNSKVRVAVRDGKTLHTLKRGRTKHERRRRVSSSDDPAPARRRP